MGKYFGILGYSLMSLLCMCSLFFCIAFCLFFPPTASQVHMYTLGHDVGSLRETCLGYQPFAPQCNNMHFPIQGPSQKQKKFLYSSGKWLHRCLGWEMPRVSVPELVCAQVVKVTICFSLNPTSPFSLPAALLYAHAILF